MRDLGFFISDFDHSGRGFSAEDLDALVHSGRVTITDRGHWLFQANPDKWSLQDDLAQSGSGDGGDWSATRYADEIQTGDAVAFWEAGAEAGIYALGIVTGTAFDRANEGYTGKGGETELAIPFRYLTILGDPLMKQELSEHPILRDLAVIRSPQGTNFRVTPEEWEAIFDLTAGDRKHEDPWTDFFYWAHRFYADSKFDSIERDFKFEIAKEINEAYEQVDSEADIEQFATALFKAGTPIVNWSPLDKLKKWMISSPQRALQAIRHIWSDGDPVDRMRRAGEIFPRSEVGGPGVRANILSLLLMCTSPESLPPYKVSVFRLGYSLVGYPQGPDKPAHAVYEHGLKFLDEMLARATEHGIELRDRLDAQALLWATLQNELPEPATDEDKVALAAWRGVVERVWWVNQGKTYEPERAGGFVWAPTQTQKGAVLSHWLNVSKLSPGEVIIHYANGAIRAISEVTHKPTLRKKPSEIEVEPWEDQGHHCRTRYFELDEPIELPEIPVALREEEKPAFNAQGGVNQAYLHPVSASFAETIRETFQERWPAGSPWHSEDTVTPPEVPVAATDFQAIKERVAEVGLRIDDRTLRRYHHSLATRGFVILSGISGTGKTWLAQVYANAVGAEFLLVPVAPNWTTNEDLLGYFNPLDGVYYDTDFSHFLRDAATEFERAQDLGEEPKDYHLLLDEMNLARVEYYFAKFLSAMEVLSRDGAAAITTGSDDEIIIYPNLKFIGTVNIDETTHGFADKVFDRAQLVELTIDRDRLAQHLGAHPAAEPILEMWDAVEPVHPFAYRIASEVIRYVNRAQQDGTPQDEALDDQFLQKVLPKLSGADAHLQQSLEQVIALANDRYPLTAEKASRMLDTQMTHGFASYF